MKEDTKNIQLATLCISKMELIWWESTTQVDLIQHGKIISSLNEFISTLHKKFYPVAYTQTTMIEWLHLI